MHNPESIVDVDYLSSYLFHAIININVLVGLEWLFFHWNYALSETVGAN